VFLFGIRTTVSKNALVFGRWVIRAVKKEKGRF
jgi:hypothetical protein